MPRVALGLLVLASCYRPGDVGNCVVSCQSNAECPDGLACEMGSCRASGATCESSSSDAMDLPDAPPGSTCAGSSGSPLGRICLGPPLPVPTPIEAGPFDTDDNVQCVAGFENICLVVVDTVDASIQVFGSKPLVLWSATTLEISSSATLDASGAPLLPGPGGDFAGCVRNGGGVDTQPMGSGGAGGSYGTLGGKGGTLLVSNTFGGGPSSTISTSDALRGGCQGAPGGGEPVNQGGHGGGVVYLIAQESIDIAGKIDASGGGAAATTKSHGGSGGGSGGLIVFDAKSISFASSAVVIALGGGGGSGTNASVTGTAGNKPTTASPFVAGPVNGPSPCGASRGGSGSTGGGPGGTAPDVSNTVSGCSGGGGGGGDGVVLVFDDSTPSVLGTVRPPPQ